MNLGAIVVSMGGKLGALRGAWALAIVKLVVHVLTLRPYGFFRDELYYIACSEHLDWGYVDHPPFCVALLKAWRVLFGDSLASIRMLPALAGAATVLVTGLLAIEMGGGLLAVAFGSVAVLVAGQYLGTAHYYSMNVFDQLFWVLVAYLVARVLRAESRRLWIVLGVVLGLGLLNKTSVLWLGAGLLVGLVVTPARSVLRTRWPYVSGAIAVLLFAPYIAWEMKHGWPTLEFMNNAMGRKYVARSALTFMKSQIDQNDPFTLPIWTAGLIALLIGRLGSEGKVLGFIYVVSCAIIVSQKTAKAEYLSPAYPMLMAAGGVFWERTIAALSLSLSRPRLGITVAVMLLSGMIVGGLISAPFALAVLSEERFVAYQHWLGKAPESSERREVNELGQFYADMHGWPELAHVVADVFDSLQAEEKTRAAIWVRSGGYGPAAAIDFFGRGRGLPPAVCSHNNYWFWGPGNGDGRAVIVVGGKPDWVSTLFEDFERVATFECRYCRPDENHKPIYVGRHLKVALSSVWLDERSFE
jgi:hypothetical protein